MLAFFRVRQHLLGISGVFSLRIVRRITLEVGHGFAGYILLAQRLRNAVEGCIVLRIVLERVLVAHIPAAIIPVFHVKIGDIQVVQDASILRLIPGKGIQLFMGAKISLAHIGRWQMRVAGTVSAGGRRRTGLRISRATRCTPLVALRGRL